MYFSCRVQDTPGSGHVLPFTLWGEAVLCRVTMAKTLGLRRGWHCTGRTFAIPAVHTFFLFLQARPLQAVGSSMLGALRAVARPQDSHFPVTGMTQSLCLSWWPFLFYDHHQLVSPRRWSLILITRSQAEGTMGLGLGLSSESEDSFISDLGQASSTLPTSVFLLEKKTDPSHCLFQQSFPLACVSAISSSAKNDLICNVTNTLQNAPSDPIAPTKCH